MKKILVAIALLVACSCAPAFAQDEQQCEEVREGVWVCDLPAKPVPPPSCKVFNKSLVCTAPLEDKKPANCGWGKKGNYVCW